MYDLLVGGLLLGIIYFVRGQCEKTLFFAKDLCTGYSLEKAQVVGIVGIVGMVGIVWINKLTDH